MTFIYANSFTYAHLADLHLGSWREPKMRELSIKAFLLAVDQCIKKEVDFILFAGDLFNTSLPSLDTLKIVTKKLKELKDSNIPLYAIAGSHDFSPSGKTMIDVLENAGLLKNVCKGRVDSETKQLHLEWTIDAKTGAKITGILGRKGLLDKTYYQNLYLKNLEQEQVGQKAEEESKQGEKSIYREESKQKQGYRIFMFHTAISELKPKHLEDLESHPVSFLPKGLNYYAGGHIHHKTEINIPEYGTMTYPGALFPNNFTEVESYSYGGYYIVTVEEKEEKERRSEPEPGYGQEIKCEQKIEWIPLQIIRHEKLILDGSGKSSEEVTSEILSRFENKNLQNTIVTIRLRGTLSSGRISDINFNNIFSQLYAQGACFIMKNTSRLQSKEYEEIKISAHNPENIEEEIIKEHLQQLLLFDKETELQVTKSLLAALNTSKKEGETVADFQRRVKEGVNNLLNI
ncbi:MAG: exonuclease SbcCD subunit D [Nanoarchaeota archaeon]